MMLDAMIEVYKTTNKQFDDEQYEHAKQLQIKLVNDLKTLVAPGNANGKIVQ